VGAQIKLSTQKQNPACCVLSKHNESKKMSSPNERINTKIAAGEVSSTNKSTARLVMPSTLEYDRADVVDEQAALWTGAVLFVDLLVCLFLVCTFSSSLSPRPSPKIDGFQPLDVIRGHAAKVKQEKWSQLF